MRRSQLSLVVLGFSVLSTPGFAQPVSPFTVSVPVIQHGPFNISEVYPVNGLSYNQIGSNPDMISDNRCFQGITQSDRQNVSVTPGVLCLGPVDSATLRLNVNSFATCQPGYDTPFVQSVRLVKTIPGSRKVPDCYPPAQYSQFGPSMIRTWWALKFTQPGTTFTLEVTTRCLKTTNRRIPEIHIDRWIWRVGVETATFPLVIDMLHSSALSIMEFPCIADERVYQDLKDLASALRAAGNQQEGQDAVFNLEGLILSECVYGDFVAPDFARPPGEGFTQPPGNLPSGTNWAPVQFQGSLTGDPSIQGGIVDTIENPCCCKLIADVEYMANNLGIVTP